jgi:hypothetical protein
MNDRRRVLAGALVVLVFLGMLPPSTLAQQPAPPAAPASQPAVVEVMPPEHPAAYRADVYDVGAGVVTVARMPFNVALCGLGAVTGTALFVLTLGTAYRATTRVFEEGCAQRWIVRGDDLRPRGAPGILTDRSSDMYSGRR